MNNPQGIRDGRGSCRGPLTRSLGAMSKVATGKVGSRHSSTGSRNRHHEARSPAHRPSGRLPSSLRTATAMRITNTTRTGEWFFNGSAVWPRGGFDSGCSFVAARLNQFQGSNARVSTRPGSGRGGFDFPGLDSQTRPHPEGRPQGCTPLFRVFAASATPKGERFKSVRTTVKGLSTGSCPVDSPFCREGHEAAAMASRHFMGLPVRSRPRS